MGLVADGEGEGPSRKEEGMKEQWEELAEKDAWQTPLWVWANFH